MISIASIGSADEPYPMIKNPWEFFSEKGTKTVFLSIGTGNSCLPDLDLAETLGCPVLKLDTPDKSKLWNEVGDILKTRKVSDTTSDFAKSASRKWVLPRNLLIQEVLPSFENGTIVRGDQIIVTKKWHEVLSEHCAKIGLPENDIRIDILKIDNCDYEDSVLQSLWNSGFRPSLLLIHWKKNPDSEIPTLLTAGHLQTLGYALVGKEANRFLYYYTDVNYYEICSWETVAVKFENPLMKELLHSLYPGSEGVSVSFPVLKKDS